LPCSARSRSAPVHPGRGTARSRRRRSVLLHCRTSRRGKSHRTVPWAA
jgi:hypothetical protein